MDFETIRPLLPGLVMLAAVTAIFWFVVIRPTKKSQAEHKELIQNLAPGDRVVTVGGIYGKVLRVREETFDLEVAKGVVMTFDRRAARKLRGED
ncbi:MAG: preprotein translocase subunit YajC [Armatimonadota bacterium]|jgi:preprotein translocase subunit YajC